MADLTNAQLREIIGAVAGQDEAFLWNECIDIAEVMCLVYARLKKKNRPELLAMYEKAKQATYFESIIKNLEVSE